MKPRQLSIIGLILSLCLASCTEKGGTVRLADFLEADSTSSRDAVPALKAAIAECVRTGAKELLLPEGTIRLRPDQATEKYLYISNNDPSMKRIAFDLEGIRGLSVRGKGTRLLFSGYIMPFYIRDCSDISLSGITIDFVRPFVTEGIIEGCGEGWYDLRFPGWAGTTIEDGIVKFKDGDGNYYPYSDALEFDSEKKEVAFHAYDHWLWNEGCTGEMRPDGVYRLYNSNFGEGTVGNVMVLGASYRYSPAITLWNCDGFSMEDVNITTCGGMGLIAQSSRNLSLERVRVEPPADSSRISSISADATHFAGCKGYIRMTDCVFRNQIDDASNIHGWYMAVDRRISDNTLMLKWKNTGQYGVDFIVEGMKMSLSDPSTLEEYAGLTVRSVENINSVCKKVTFNEKLPERVAPGDILSEDDEYPEVLISGCYIGNNRARGLLIGSRGKVVIENNHFHTAGASILFEGDGRYWFEQAGVRDVIIRGNLFDNCLYGNSTWGKACIAVGTGIPDKEHSRYNRNILVENNVFRGFDSRIVNLYSVDGFTFRGNRIEESGDYTPCTNEERFIIEYCDNIDIKQ